MPRDDKLRIGIKSNPGPNIARAFWGRFGRRDVLLLSVTKGPRFIELQALAGKIYERAILIFGKRLPSIDKELEQCRPINPVNRVIALSAIPSAII